MSELFKIESQQPPAVEMICGNCVHFVPYKDYKTMRVHPSKAAHCSWRCPVLPISALRFGHLHIPKVQVFKDTNAKECKCFTAKKK